VVLDTNTNKKQEVEKFELIQDEIVEDWYFSEVFCMKINKQKSLRFFLTIFLTVFFFYIWLG